MVYQSIPDLIPPDDGPPVTGRNRLRAVVGNHRKEDIVNIIIKRPYTPAFSRAVGHPVSVGQLRKIVGSPAHVRYGPYGIAVVYNPKSRGEPNFKMESIGYIRGNAVFVGCDGQQLTGLDQKQEAYIWRELLRG